MTLLPLELLNYCTNIQMPVKQDLALSLQTAKQRNTAGGRHVVEISTVVCNLIQCIYCCYFNAAFQNSEMPIL